MIPATENTLSQNTHDEIQDRKELEALLLAGVSPFHTILHAVDFLKKQGFQPLSLNGKWNLIPGQGYFIPVYGSTLVGFTVGRDVSPAAVPSLRLAASHTDWPCLMVKPDPEMTAGPYARLNVSVYGGPILNTWLDRPLSLAGKVCLRSEDPFQPTVRFIHVNRPLLTIPNLAIHFNRDVNKGMELNPQIDMIPILSLLDETLNRDHFFLHFLAGELKVQPEDILDYQCCLYNCDEPQLLGIRQELLSSPRLDNLTSVHACLSGLASSSRENGIRAAVLFDNEEIGNGTKQGAASPLMERILEKIYGSLGFGRTALLDALFDGFLLSLDVAHAFHPNKAGQYDPVNRVSMGDGVALKLSVSQSYATDASCVSAIEALCDQEGIPCRKFSNRSDIRGGSTLGSVSSCLLNIKTVDAGVPILAMHSSRELMAWRDQHALASLTRAFLR